MKGYVEKMISEYPHMVREREHLKKQIETQEFLSADELICAMSFSHPDGERVQSSDLSDMMLWIQRFHFWKILLMSFQRI